MRRLVSIAVAMVGLLVVAPVAAAEIRTVTAQDPADRVLTVSGVPNSPDIKQVLATYDSVGKLSITVEFYNRIDQLDTSQNYKFWGKFNVGDGYAIWNDPASCGAGGSSGALYGQHNILGSFYDRASVGDYEGYLDFNRTDWPDEKTITISASSPVLANRNYRCLEYTLNARSRSSISNIYSDYDAGCDCWYLSPTLDTLRGEVKYGVVTTSHGVWFDGFQPPPPPPPPPPAQVKGKLRVTASGGCRRASLNSWNVLPWAGGAPATGTIRAKIGRQVREFPASRTEPVRWNRVRGGARTIHVAYLGDERRTAATTLATVTVYRTLCSRR